MTTTCRIDRIRQTAPKTASLLLVSVWVVCLGTSGCALLDVLPFRQAKSVDDMANTDNIRGPLERRLRTAAHGRSKEGDSFKPTEGIADFEQAEKLYEAGKHKQAEKALKKIAKEYKDSRVQEDALFLLGEIQFQQKRYSWAQDSFDKLLKAYPSTRYMDRVTRRMFTIARTWLDFPEVATSEDVQPVNFDDPQSTPPPKSEGKKSRDPSLAVPIFPNFFDRTRPVFDTKGRALQALRSIWLNDPTGPLADDALMLTASHHLRRGDHMEADRIFSMLREEYPKSPHLKSAFVLGSHVKLMSYQGALYDGTNLEDARQLKESTLRLFPDDAGRERQRQELKKIDEARAQRDWEQARYYMKRDNRRGAAIYCQEVIKNFPETGYADRARRLLAELSPDNPLSRPVRDRSESPEFEPVPAQPVANDEAPGRTSL